jgi:hypothetical protein
MGFWNFFGLASKRDHDMVVNKLEIMGKHILAVSEMCKSLTEHDERIIQKISDMESALQKWLEKTEAELDSLSSQSLQTNIQLFQEIQKIKSELADVKSMYMDNRKQTETGLKGIHEDVVNLQEMVKLTWINDILSDLKKMTS